MTMRREFLDRVIGNHLAVVVKGDNEQHLLGINDFPDHLAVTPLFSRFILLILVVSRVAMQLSNARFITTTSITAITISFIFIIFFIFDSITSVITIIIDNKLPRQLLIFQTDNAIRLHTGVIDGGGIGT